MDHQRLIKNLTSNKLLIFPGLIIVLFIILLIFRIHGSSLANYNISFLGNNFQDSNLLFGEPRGIRSDEWLLETPLIIAQAQNNFLYKNDLFLVEQNFLTIDVPVKHWTLLFEPQNWAFFFMPLENAYAFRWWFLPFLMVIAFYFLSLKITKNDTLISIAFSLSLFFSPFFQWWYSTPAFDITAFGVLAFLFLIDLFKSKNVLRIILSGMLFSYFAICFVLVFYPAWQIPFFWLLFFSFLGLVFSNKEKFLSNSKSINTSIFFLSVLLIILTLLFFYLENSELIKTIASTAYPGNRKSSGGGLNIYNTIGGFFNIQLQNGNRTVPSILGNQSEASSFFFISILIFPFVVFDIVYSLIKKTFTNWVLLFIAIFNFLCLLWGFDNLPDLIGKILLLDRVNGNRILMVLGIMNHLILLYYLISEPKLNNRRVKILLITYSLIVAIFIYLFGLELSKDYPDFISYRLKIFIITGIVTSLVLLILFRRKILFSILLLSWSFISSYSVNPLYKGLSPIIDNQLVDKLSSIKVEEEEKWIIYDNLLLENYLTANNLSTINGTYIVPHLEFWGFFDDTNEFKNIYNRYAHIIITNNENQNAVDFELIQNDVFRLHINPCNEKLNKLNVDNFIFLSRQEFDCLIFENKIDLPKVDYYIYSRR